MINELQKKLKLKLKNQELLLQAVTHSSFSNENENSPDNEKLEFLGDAVVGLLMANYLYKKGYKDEGELTKKRAQAVCEEALYLYSTHIELSKYLRLGKGLEDSRESMAVNADAFEAVFGAVYLDLGFAAAKNLFYRIVVPNLKEVKTIKDYKSTLQEYMQVDRKNIAYILEKEKGPSHNKLFTVCVKVDGIVFGIGTAKSKKEAEQNAAKEALSKLAKEQ